MFKVLDEKCKPTKGSKYSAAVDLYSNEDIEILAGETAIVGLGVCLDEVAINEMVLTVLPYGYENRSKEMQHRFLNSHYLQLEPRSSLRAKGIIGCTGIIDIDYKQEIKIVLHNFNNEEFLIKKGDKIAQILLKEHNTYLFGIESESERVGGFGSTDTPKVHEGSENV